MVATRMKIAKPLMFEITAPLGMGLSKGSTGREESVGASYSLNFSVCPSKFSSRQNIYLAPTGEDTGGAMPIEYATKKLRQLTAEIEGSLQFNMRSLPEQEVTDGAKAPIGELSHIPEYSSGDNGHAEFYCIEIGLPENEFRYIRDIFLAGKPPTSITIWTPDVEHGVAPDGSDKVWAVSDVHGTFATIVEFGLAFSTDLPRVGVGIKKTERDEENDAEEITKLKEAILHSREDIQLLCYGQAAMNAAIVGLRKQINVLIAVVIGIAIVMILHFRF